MEVANLAEGLAAAYEEAYSVNGDAVPHAQLEQLLAAGAEAGSSYHCLDHCTKNSLLFFLVLSLSRAFFSFSLVLSLPLVPLHGGNSALGYPS
jgi:hypothetical protein